MYVFIAKDIYVLSCRMVCEDCLGMTMYFQKVSLKVNTDINLLVNV